MLFTNLFYWARVIFSTGSATQSRTPSRKNYIPNTLNSTLRFSALPSGVALVAIGLV